MRTITKVLYNEANKAEAIETLKQFQPEPGAYMLIVIPPTMYMAVNEPVQPKDYAEEAA